MQPGLLVSKYRLAQPLGRGGMGEVWKAFDTELKRWVALKFLLGDNPVELARFQREAELAGALSHPNIAAIYDVGTATVEQVARHFIAMQFVDGQTLKTFPARDVTTLVRLLRDAARALAYAHRQGVIHRDIKPENLMVEEERLFVMDFGLARQVDTQQSLSGFVVGTPAYMAPEQARGELATPQADVWSLGATLYELLTRRQPFAGQNVLDLLCTLQESDPIAPRKLAPAIDADLETILLKCLEKNPARRYDGPAELSLELDRWLNGEPIQARAVSTVEKLVRRVRRNKPLSAAIAAAIVIALAAGVLFLVQRQHASAALASVDQGAREREARLKRLSGLWTTIIEKKQELRRLLSPVEKSRPALEAAVAALDRYILEAPGDPQGWYVRARGRLYLADLERAEQDARKAIALAADFRPGWTLLGMVLIEKYSDARYGDPLSTNERLRDAQPTLDAAIDAFRRGWRAEDVQAETARWGLAWTREDDVQERLARAHQLRHAGDNAEAARLLESALQEYRSEDYLLFLNRHTEAIELAPGFAEALVDRGTGRSAQKQYVGAIADYTEALRLRPDFVRALNNRGNARRLQGDLEGAIADFTEAIRCEPGYGRAFSNRANVRTLKGEYEAAIADANEAIRVDPTDVRALTNRARAKRLRGDFDGAIADFTEALRLRPDYAEAYNGRGLAREDRKDRDGAMADFNESIRLHTDAPESFYNRGNVKMRTGDFDGAIADFTEAIRLRPDFAQAFMNRGNTRLDVGRDLKGALADYNEAIRLQSAMPEAFFNRGLAKERMKDFDGALADYAAALRLRPDYAQALVNSGAIKFTKGQVDAAMEDYRQAIRLKPDLPEAHLHLGNAKERKGDYDGAIAAYTEAIRLRAAYPQAFFNRGLIRRRNDDFDGAIADYTEAIRLRPVYPDALYNRALSWRALGENAKAIADLEKALEIAPVTWTRRDVANKVLNELRMPK